MRYEIPEKEFAINISTHSSVIGRLLECERGGGERRQEGETPHRPMEEGARLRGEVGRKGERTGRRTSERKGGGNRQARREGSERGGKERGWREKRDESEVGGGGGDDLCLSLPPRYVTVHVDNIIYNTTLKLYNTLPNQQLSFISLFIIACNNLLATTKEYLLQISVQSH